MLMVATGNKAVAEAVRQAKPAVIAAYPITPQTGIVEQIADYVTHGDLLSRYIPVESEHSAMAACIGASAYRSADIHRNKLARPALHARDDQLGSWSTPAYRDGKREPCNRAGLEYLGRTYRCNAGA